MIKFVRTCIHALTPSCSTGPPRPPRPSFPPGSARTPPTGVFPQGDRLEAHDEVWPAELRLPSGRFPASWPLLRMDLQGQGQNRQREAQPASRAALSGRHKTTPQAQGHSGQDGAPVANRLSPLGQASCSYRLNRASTIATTDCRLASSSIQPSIPFLLWHLPSRCSLSAWFGREIQVRHEGVCGPRGKSPLDSELL